MCNDRRGRHARLANQFFVGSPFSRWAAEARSSCRYSRGQKAALGRAPQTGKRPFFLSANRQEETEAMKPCKSWMSRGCRGHCSQPADWGLFLRKPGFSAKWLRIDTELLLYGSLVINRGAAEKESCCLPAICDADDAVGADLGVEKNIQLFRHFNMYNITLWFCTEK